MIGLFILVQLLKEINFIYFIEEKKSEMCYREIYRFKCLILEILFHD
jgi:hypothetical protein